MHEGGLQFLWVVDFPLFEALDDDGRPIPAHHPFTMPHPDDLELLDARHRRRPARACARRPTTSCSTAGSSARAACGSTVPTCSSGSSRCSASTTEEAQAQFGFLLDAFRYGAPPHAGFAFGIDRLVALLAGEENIREVIAFPKTQSGADPLTGAPRRRSTPPSCASSACACCPSRPDLGARPADRYDHDQSSSPGVGEAGSKPALTRSRG